MIVEAVAELSATAAKSNVTVHIRRKVWAHLLLITPQFHKPRSTI